ncbi:MULTISPECIES: hypothetical protein [unclassified Streptomyces]|uniref:hypothetical protein n=1 Tax=unclassified Streptomyces TaxID=2593676 RepID=UPI002DD8905D|nr:MULTISPECIES: hypothetical protein [unclassified Streptomyces]WSS46834.1 hypothetical protein OG220_40450 [Streptomyces sp. NBC_01187]WSA97649.1 hypothetical protein OIE63_39770 [Streptomyces sp. NBC_01795]WSB82101.1 hypothetical protein OHB04_41045 [Streptomyces sp. NBC_01775]WSS18072.1 hypothetical protein OG533_40125 [Streptomyces sp. NBC_01186]WSS46949.1 hypothetical protein OG220_41175 [Streptomyces sp. NBC_01187]
MHPMAMGRLATLASTALLLAGVVSAGSAQAQSAAQARYPGGLITYSIEFSNPQENDNNDLPEPYGQVFVKDNGFRQTTLWEHPDLDINTPTLPRYPESGPTHRFADHSISEVCAFVGEDDTGINADDILARGCAPFHGPGTYTIPGADGKVTVTVYHIG